MAAVAEQQWRYLEGRPLLGLGGGLLVELLDLDGGRRAFQRQRKSVPPAEVSGQERPTLPQGAASPLLGSLVDGARKRAVQCDYGLARAVQCDYGLARAVQCD